MLVVSNVKLSQKLFKYSSTTEKKIDFKMQWQCNKILNITYKYIFNLVFISMDFP